MWCVKSICSGALRASYPVVPLPPAARHLSPREAERRAVKSLFDLFAESRRFRRMRSVCQTSGEFRQLGARQHRAFAQVLREGDNLGLLVSRQVLDFGNDFRRSHDSDTAPRPSLKQGTGRRDQATSDEFCSGASVTAGAFPFKLQLKSPPFQLPRSPSRLPPQVTSLGFKVLPTADRLLPTSGKISLLRR